MNANEREEVIQVTDLRRVYGGGFEAVRGITLSVARGELFALLGTNGAGKTSTMELLEGLAPPTGARVRILGHDPYEERAAVRPRIGVMLQEGGFPSELTVTQTVRMWAGCTTGARPTGEALELVGLAHRAGVRVKQLSGGEKRRLDLALALLGRPEILFLDEPTTGLDAEGRMRTWELVRELRTGELTDREILVGSALPAVCIGVVQCVLLAVGCMAFLDAGAPRAPHLVLLGLLSGLVLCVALAAVTATFSRTVESAQITALPLLFVSMFGSGITIPTDLLPHRVASLCELLPLSPAMRLIRGGWTGGLSAHEALTAGAVAVAWTVLAVFAVRRWFRWEPRR
ncbi:ABC transporter ATP-binding protein/permease [Streptomyces sp. NPDC002573]|uniref:ABC transporter ATP-binding protein/permease n=1 Tax=Streptomyces sp. NPDC002573 TaxID=3364651 RepID=UPI00368D61CD